MVTSGGGLSGSGFICSQARQGPLTLQRCGRRGAWLRADHLTTAVCSQSVVGWGKFRSRHFPYRPERNEKVRRIPGAAIALPAALIAARMRRRRPYPAAPTKEAAFHEKTATAPQPSWPRSRSLARGPRGDKLPFFRRARSLVFWTHTFPRTVYFLPFSFFSSPRSLACVWVSLG